MGGAERGTDATVWGSSRKKGEWRGGRDEGISVPLSSLLGVGLICNGTGVGVVDLTTSTDACFGGDDTDCSISGVVGVVDPLTSVSGTVEGGGVLLTSDVEGTVGVVDILTSDAGERGSVNTYLLDSETVARWSETFCDVEGVRLPW